MPIHEDEFATLQFEGLSWDGQLSTTWIGPKTGFLIYSNEFTGQDYKVLSDETKDYINRIADQSTGAFSSLESFLFDHYQAEIYLKLYPDCEYAPLIQTAPEIWNLVSGPSILVPSLTGRSKYNVGFYTLFDCIWDPEHGFAVEHGHDFHPRSVDGIDQCCY